MSFTGAGREHLLRQGPEGPERRAVHRPLAGELREARRLDAGRVDRPYVGHGARFHDVGPARRTADIGDDGLHEELEVVHHLGKGGQQLSRTGAPGVELVVIGLLLVGKSGVECLAGAGGGGDHRYPRSGRSEGREDRHAEGRDAHR